MHSALIILTASLALISSALGAKKVVGFYQWARSYPPYNFTIDLVNPQHYTHIKYAFVNIDPEKAAVFIPQLDESRNFNELFPSDDNQCRCCARGYLNQLFRLKEQNPHLSTMLAVGGWEWSKHFSTVAATPEKRTSFVKSCLQFMTDYGMDGIDIDYEFPGSATGKNVGKPDNVFSRQDTPNLIELLAEFRRQMEELEPGRFLLTLDVAPIPWYMDAAQTKELAGILDWFNIMSYEFSLDGRSVTRHASQLFNNPDDPNRRAGSDDYLTFANSVNWFLKAGAAPDQIVMGVPAYAREYTGVVGGSNGLYGRIGGERDKLVLYRDLLPRIDSGALTYHWDDDAKAPYASGSGGIFITYDDVRSVKEKAAFINQGNLGGIMLWDMASDISDPSLSLAKATFDSLQGEKEQRPKGSKAYQPLSNYCNIAKELKVEFDPNGKPGAARSSMGRGKSRGNDGVKSTVIASLQVLMLLSVAFLSALF